MLQPLGMIFYAFSMVLSRLKTASLWWRDVRLLGGAEDGGWVVSNVSNVIGKGDEIRFCKERWLDSVFQMI
jgi:hypothetical protein